jgi:hypothetical protein
MNALPQAVRQSYGALDGVSMAGSEFFSGNSVNSLLCGFWANEYPTDKA